MLAFIQSSTTHNKLFVKVFMTTSFCSKIAPELVAIEPLKVAYCVWFIIE